MITGKVKKFTWMVLLSDGNGVAVAKYKTMYVGDHYERACSVADTAARTNPGFPVYVLAQHHKYFARQETVVTVVDD